MGERARHGEQEAETAHPDAAAPFRIFLNYRREDSAGHAGWLWESLRSGVEGQPGFADDQIFMDIDTIEPGVDFREAIRKAVEASDVFLTVIGKQWLTVVDSKGRRRLDDPSDFVRIEIEAALERAAQHHDVRVMPTRVQGADMPGSEDLPDALADLAHRHAVELTDARWHYDVGQLLTSLKKLERDKLERTSAAREAAEGARREREAAEQAKREKAEREAAERKATGRREPVIPRDRNRKRAVAAAILVALVAVAAAVLIGLLRDGEQPSGEETPSSPRPSGAFVWQRAGGAGLGGQGDQAMTSIVNTKRGGLAYIAGGYDASAGSRDAAIWTSEDGRTWRRVHAEDFERAGDQTIRSVTDFGGELVALGTDDSNGDEDIAAWRSSDGVRWDAVAGLRAPGTDEVLNRVTNTRVGLVAAGWRAGDGDDAAVWIGSEPGADPVADPDFGGPGDQRIARVEQVGRGNARQFVAVGLDDGDAGVWVSTDGQAWDRVDAADLGGDGHQEILDATRFESSVVAVGHDGDRGAVWISEDGETWTRVPDPEGALAPRVPVMLNRVIRGTAAAALVAGGSAGDDAAVWVSDDGMEWMREPSGELGGDGAQTITSLRAGAELGVIAVGSSGPENSLDAAVWVGASR